MIVALTSAAGSPGVTTTSLGLACAGRPRVAATAGRDATADAVHNRQTICLEADPVGGSAVLAGYYRGFESPEVSLVDLLLASRRGDLAASLDQALVALGDGRFVLPGPRSHRQAGSALELWPALAGELASRPSADVVVDLGRLGMASYAEAFLWVADAIALVMRCDLPAVSAARQWAEWLRDLRQSRPEMGSVGLILIGPGRPYSPREIGHGLELPVWATIDWNPAGAAVYSVGAHRRRQRLSSQYAVCGAALRQVAESRRLVLGGNHG